MNPEELKENEAYNARIRYVKKDNNGDYFFIIEKDETYLRSLILTSNQVKAAVFPLSDPSNGIKNAETAPKYNPCRKFRKGDIVRVVEWNGRDIDSIGLIARVDSDEYNSRVKLSIDEWTKDIYPACHLDLVTPVEELERYVVIHNGYEKYYEVCWKDDDEPDGSTGRTRCLTTFWYHNPPKTHTQEHAKNAAQAECDRLNAEWKAAHNAELTAQNAELRKEQDNG